MPLSGAACQDTGVDQMSLLCTSVFACKGLAAACTGNGCSDQRSFQPNTTQGRKAVKKGSLLASTCLQVRDSLSQQWLFVCLATLQQFVLSKPYKLLVAAKSCNKVIYNCTLGRAQIKIILFTIGDGIPRFSLMQRQKA